MRNEFYIWEGWPRPVIYKPKENNLFNAKAFLAARPHKVCVAKGGIYSLDLDYIWQLVEQDSFAAEIQKTNEPELLLDSAGVHAVIAGVKLLCHTDAQPFEWITRPPGAPDPVDMIPFRNGLLNFKTKELLKYDGSYFATGRPDVDYDPEANCPRWDQALQEWFEQSSDDRLSMVPTLQEFVGYALTPDTRYHAILALLGAGRAGKSTIVDVLTKLCGLSHCKTRVLGDLAGPHGLQGLEDARIIVIPDAADTNLGNRAQALGRIKAISGGDMVSINPKNAKPFQVRIPARFVMVANRHPKFLDESGALAMRELPIMFTRSFQGDETRDPELGARLERELPGIANWALQGLMRLRLKGRFTESEALQRARADIEGQQSPMATFAAQCLKFQRGARIRPTAMFAAYETWASYTRLTFSERRNRQEFKGDLLASSVASRWGVRLKQVWHKGKNIGHHWTNVELNQTNLQRFRSDDFGPA